MRLRRKCAGLPPRCGPWEAGPEAELHACRGAAMGGAVMRPATAAAAVSSQPRAARNCPQRAAGRSLRGQRRCRSCESCMCPALFKCQRHGGSSSCRRCAQPWCGQACEKGHPPASAASGGMASGCSTSGASVACKVRATTGRCGSIALRATHGRGTRVKGQQTTRSLPCSGRKTGMGALLWTGCRAVPHLDTASTASFTASLSRAVKSEDCSRVAMAVAGR